MAPGRDLSATGLVSRFRNAARRQGLRKTSAFRWTPCGGRLTRRTRIKFHIRKEQILRAVCQNCHVPPLTCDLPPPAQPSPRRALLYRRCRQTGDDPCRRLDVNRHLRCGVGVFMLRHRPWNPAPPTALKHRYRQTSCEGIKMAKTLRSLPQTSPLEPGDGSETLR